MQTYSMKTLPDHWRAVARQYEAKFGINFAQFKFFPAEFLKSLQADVGRNEAACIISPERSKIENAIGILKQVAGIESSRLTKDDRQQYLSGLLDIYRALPESPLVGSEIQDWHFVGVEREGRILAKELGWLPAGRSERVHAKRMRVGTGILVGLSEFSAVGDCGDTVIVDGAIASGATLMAIMDALGHKRVRIYSAHAAGEGARSLCEFAKGRGIDLRLLVGFVTPGLDARYYAVEGGQLVVGDLGDMIAELFEPQDFDGT